MTETSTVTPQQALSDKLGTQHPGKQILAILDRVERLEKGGLEQKIVKSVKLPDKNKSEIMKAARVRRKANEKNSIKA